MKHTCPPIPYGRHWVDQEDITEVVNVLRSDWLTTGPRVEQFERQFAAAVSAEHAVALCNGTAALHAAMHVLGVGPGDEVLVPAMTFAATANAVLYQRATPVFVDVEPETLLIDTTDAQRKVTARTRALVAVDYAGQPCDYDALNDLARRHDLALVADACHSLGGTYRDRPVGTLADVTVFSLHPVKPITTGEGGMLTTMHASLAARAGRFRNHGIVQDLHRRQGDATWFYEQTELGHNYRLSDIQCALGISQIRKLGDWVTRRNQIAARYHQALAHHPAIEPLHVKGGVVHAYHLYVVRLTGAAGAARRESVFRALRASGIGVNVHYIPVHLHPYYRNHEGTRRGMCPAAEAAYEQILSLPVYPRMRNAEVDRVIETLLDILAEYRTFAA